VAVRSALSAVHGNERARFGHRFCKALRSISAATTKIQDGAIADAVRGAVMNKAYLAVKLLQPLANRDATALSSFGCPSPDDTEIIRVMVSSAVFGRQHQMRWKRSRLIAGSGRKWRMTDLRQTTSAFEVEHEIPEHRRRGVSLGPLAK